MRVLLTNDDGIEAEGLQALRRALLEIPEVELAVIAPDGNRSAMARMITTRRPLWVQEVEFDDGTVGYGEGVPREYVTGETAESAYAALCDQQAPALGLFAILPGC